eukprot:769071_1
MWRAKESSGKLDAWRNLEEELNERNRGTISIFPTFPKSSRIDKMQPTPDPPPFESGDPAEPASLGLPVPSNVEAVCESEKSFGGSRRSSKSVSARRESVNISAGAGIEIEVAAGDFKEEEEEAEAPPDEVPDENPVVQQNVAQANAP